MSPPAGTLAARRINGPHRPLPIHDFSPDTLLSLVERIESSSGFQHFIFREAELDDLWRQVEHALVSAQSKGRSTRDIDRLRILLDCVVAAHDLVSVSKKDEANGAAAGRHSGPGVAPRASRSFTLDA